jgi:hypothetical protein
MLAVERRVTAVVLSDGGVMSGPQGAVQLDPEVLQTRAIFDVARSGLLACVSGPVEAIDLAEAHRLLDALTIARVLAEDAEDRVLTQCSLLTGAAAERRAIARRAVVCRPAARRALGETDTADTADDDREAGVIRLHPSRATALPAASRDTASILMRAVLPAAAAFAGAAHARRFRQP